MIASAPKLPRAENAIACKPLYGLVGGDGLEPPTLSV